MKIIQKGEIPEERHYRLTCSHCKTIFEIQYKEGKVTQDHQMDPAEIHHDCPVCHRDAYQFVSKPYTQPYSTF